MHIGLRLRRWLLAVLAALVALAGCGGGFSLYFGDGGWPVQLEVLAPKRIETGQDFTARPGGLDGYGGLSFEWDFGDGSSLSLTAEPVHRFDRAGSYTIRLRVSDGWERLQASLRVEVGAWSIVEGRPCTGVDGSGWCRLDAPGDAGAPLDGLWFFDAHEGVARDAGGALWRSSDGGRHWTRAAMSPHGRPKGEYRRAEPEGTPVSAPGRSQALIPQRASAEGSPASARAGFAPDGSGWDLRGGQLWRSPELDRGWQAERTPEGTLLAAQFVDRRHGWLRTRDCEGCAERLYRTQDGARSWQPMTLPAGADTLHFVDREQGLATDGRSAAWTTRDGGWSWTPAAVNFGRSGGRVQRVVFAGTQQGWMLVADAAGTAWLLRSSDGGRSWTAPQPAPGERVADLAFGDAGHGWAVDEAGAIWATRDGGLSWQAQASGSAAALRVLTALDARTAWAAGAQGTLLATATGGR